MFIKAGDGNELYTVVEPIPTLGIKTSLGGISKIISNDDGTIYALSAGPSASKQVVELNAASHTTVRDGDVTDIFPSNVGFGYISSNHQFVWKDSENISSFGEIGSDVDYGLRIENGSFKVMRGDGIYKPRFKKDYSIDAVQSFRQSADIKQISPYDSVADALLVSSDSDGQTRYCRYSGSAQQIHNVIVRGAKQYSLDGGDGEDGEATVSKVEERQTFSNSMIVENASNRGLFIEESPYSYYCSKDGFNLAEWIIDEPNGFTSQKVFSFNNRYYVIVEDDGLQKIWSFDDHTDKFRVFNKIRERGDNGKGNFQKFTGVGNNQYLLESDDGVFLVRNSDVMRLTYSDMEFRSIKYVDFGVGDPMYYFAI